MAGPGREHSRDASFSPWLRCYIGIMIGPFAQLRLRLSGTPPERWFWLGLTVILAVFVTLLWTGSTGVGRGGR